MEFCIELHCSPFTRLSFRLGLGEVAGCLGLKYLEFSLSSNWSWADDKPVSCPYLSLPFLSISIAMTLTPIKGTKVFSFSFSAPLTSVLQSPVFDDDNYRQETLLADKEI